MDEIGDRTKNIRMEHEDEEFERQLFDGELLKRRLGRFLSRLNTALADAQNNLPDFEIQSIWVDTVVGINGQVNFPSGAGVGLEHSRSIQFILKPRTEPSNKSNGNI